MVNKYLKGGKSEGMTLSQVAKLHNMNAEQLKPQLNKGIKHELEHTRNLKEARRIALDHLVEFPDYYDRLDKIEKMHLGGDMSKHLAPNGKPSNLTHEQWHLVRTPEFKAWFGDWENDPENASKVVDENGEPLVVHHGSIVETNFDIFDYQKADLGFHFGTEEQAKNRVESKGVLPSRKSIVNSFFLNIRVLFEMSDAGEWQYPQRYVDELMSDNIIEEKVAKQKGFLSLNMREDNAIIRDYLKSKYGNSVGFVYNNKYEGKGKSFIVLSPNEIKLADGSNTTFDGENPDIRFDKGGEIENLIDQGEIELKVYPTTPKHANLYGLKSENPLYIQTIFISENQRLKGIGKKVLKYLNDFAIENGHDVMFGHITQKASFSKDDSRESNLDDVAMIKNWLQSNGYEICEGNNDFYKVVNNPDIRFEKGGLIAPNGKPSNLTPQQYDLVRTPEFKAWFGDWENDPENASKVVDENGEPLVVYRGYPKKRKFPFVFEYKYRMFGKSGVAGREKNEFAFYFTDLKKVAENYGENLADDDEAFVVKEYFLNIRNIFKGYSRKNQYEITFKELYDLANYTGKPIYELNPDNEVALFYQKNEKGQYEMLPREYWNYDYSTINRYRDSEPKETFAYFVDWDKNSSNQFFWGSYLRRYLKYDGLVFYERTHNSLMNPDRDKNDYHSIEKPWVIPQFGDEFSKTYAVFESNQIKLADGTNTTFDGKNPDIRFDKGGRTIAQTPAPASDRVYGSKTNPKGSASDSELAKSIKFNDKLEKAIQNKVDEFNDKHPSNKVSLSTAKAIVRRGMGAYSKSHRPTISGGAPNSRQAWGLARLNKFLLKKSGVKVKKAYVQDDDLLKYAKGGKINMGDCYEVAGRMALMEASKAPNGEIFLGQPKVVHGEVAGQGSLEGIRYGHAWVEDDVYVYDFSNGRELMILKEVYYYLGKIMQEKPKLYKYTFKEATKKMVESRNFGPWDLITESGL